MANLSQYMLIGKFLKKFIAILVFIYIFLKIKLARSNRLRKNSLDKTMI